MSSGAVKYSLCYNQFIMQPQSSGNIVPEFSPEQQAPQYTPEQLPDAPTTPETPLESPERSVAAEQLAVDHIGQTMQPVAVPQPIPEPAQPVADNDQTDVTITKSTPQTAADGDTIEKEWIDRVQQIISSTRDDPHAQQSEISRLMADYVLKRFGRKIGASEEQTE
jgi:hypothetical protein